MNRVPIQPVLLRWARERAGYGADALAGRFPKLHEWERGEVQPTLKQLEAFAKATHAPVGFFFLAEPPVERVPIPDFRTVANIHMDRPSPDLLDTVYLCQQRQDWSRDFARSMHEPALDFVGSARLDDDIVRTAATMRRSLGLDLEERRKLASWTDALQRFIDQADALGVLVMVSGVVGSNNRRGLNPHEFRGFALADPLAPLVFINGADTKAAQMFTLAHELAHLWLGQSAVSDAEARAAPAQGVERWCNRVAAELLVPLSALRDEFDGRADLRDELRRLARRFKVSSLVILRRIHDAGQLARDELWTAYDAELERLNALPKGDGGNFYLTLGARVSKRFARALVVNTLEGRTAFTETFRMLGLKKMTTFNELGRSLGVGILMAYLLDANVFIAAKNLHYGLDFCPAFWDWLVAGNESERVFSIEKVGDEVQAVGDELSAWAAARGVGFFLPPDASVFPAMAEVSAWATGQEYEPAAVSMFLQVADYYLVAQARAGGHTVVTHEVPSASIRKIKIPDVCISLDIGCITPYQMLRRERARFVLGTAS